MVTRRDNDTIAIRFRQLLIVPAVTLGFPAPPDQVLVPPQDESKDLHVICGMLAQLIEKTQEAQMLVGVDIFDQPWVLVASQMGTGWTKLKTNPLPDPEESKAARLVTGGQAIDEMNQLPPVKE